MEHSSYLLRRARIEDYFDRTAVKAWEQLTSNVPVGRIRATVRAGRERMRETLLGWLPADLNGARVLDAGCGTGALALEAARRGAEVVAIDLSPQLVQLARERIASEADGVELLERIDLRSGDMLAPELGSFDHVVAMDSLIHYDLADAARAVETWAWRTRASICITFAPRNPMLVAMQSVGRLFPRANRAPWIEPMSEAALRQRLQRAAGLDGWSARDTQRVASGFYTSQALRLCR